MQNITSMSSRESVVNDLFTCAYTTECLIMEAIKIKMFLSVVDLYTSYLAAETVS